jgi:hypothetical protein
MITSSGSTPSASRRRARTAFRLSDPSHSSSTSSRVLPTAVSALPSIKPRRRRCSITSGTPPARKTRTVVCGPFGSASTRRGTRRFTPIHSSIVGGSSPAACATAGRCSRRFVEPPKAACTAIALRTATSVTRSRVVMPSSFCRNTARADLRAASSHTGWPEGASALCGTASPSASATTCEVAAVPRN